eukprot:scaffold79389_cov32-Prasinocladus_malaysianus.AAC.2
MLLSQDLIQEAEVTTMLRRGQSEQELAARLERKFADRASFELAEDELEALRVQINSQAFLTAPSRLHADVTALNKAQALKDAEFQEWKARHRKHPSVLDKFVEFSQWAHGKRLAVFLDYDGKPCFYCDAFPNPKQSVGSRISSGLGTLAPIVKNPDEAFMSEQMRLAVRDVAKMYPTAIISGRGREKVESFVQLQELYYAGSHGLDIVGPKLLTRICLQEENGGMSFQPAAKFGPIMTEVFGQLSEGVANIPGATVEDNKFCVSVHFRNCDPADHPQVEKIVQDTLARHVGLKMSRGRKLLPAACWALQVFEVKPMVDWDKGKALQHLLEALELHKSADVMPLYIGDDRTDEDAFKVLKAVGTGCGILVSTKPKPTAAYYHLSDPAEVGTFLSKLVEWGQDEGNGWHKNVHCNGWTPIYSRARSDPQLSSQAAADDSP